MEKSIKGSRTEQNLLKAFAGESQARNRYEFFVKVATEEGYMQIAAIFRRLPIRNSNMPNVSLNSLKVEIRKLLLPILPERSAPLPKT